MARCLFWTLLLIAISAPAHAHNAGMTVATVIPEERSTLIELSVKGSDLERVAKVELIESEGNVDAARLVSETAAIKSHLIATAAIEADGPDCPLTVVDLTAVGDAVLANLKAPCGTAHAGLSYRSTLLHETNPTTVQHLMLLKGDDAYPVALTKEHNRIEIQAPISFTETATRYLVTGAQHILIGYDHIAFLIALLLWARNVWSVIKVVTAFTLSHSITLSLAALDIVTLPSGLIEPLIAASIVAVALENFFDKRIERRWRVAFVLGFIHGFGFAAALRDIGLPHDALLVALAFFNIGVELGQVAIVAMIVPLLLVIDRLTARVPMVPTIPLVPTTPMMPTTPMAPTRKPALVYAVSILIAVLGGYWFIERTLLT